MAFLFVSFFFAPVSAKKKRLKSLLLSRGCAPRKRKTKSFRPPFSKGGAVEGAEPSPPSADGGISKMAFLFVSFFFAPVSAKKKRIKDHAVVTRLRNADKNPHFKSRADYY